MRTIELDLTPPPAAAVALADGPACIVFDIGGTWFRSGVAVGDRVVAVTRRPAISYRRHPDRPVHELQRDLVAYLVAEARRLRRERPGLGPSAAGISMGAALNAHTGLLLDSGPLWGPECFPFDLVGALRAEAPELDWYVVNDVTAALLQYVATSRDEARRITLVTVSTGIACRTFDAGTGAIPVDAVHGLQGEIGHLPVDASLLGTRLDVRCDCGGQNHLNAVASGRGIEQLLALLPRLARDRAPSSVLGRELAAGAAPSFAAWADAVHAGDALALEVLDAATLPLARILVTLATVDAAVERIVLTGGVVETIGRVYRDRLLGALDAVGMYQVTERDPRFFDEKVRLHANGGELGLGGAGIFTRTTLRERDGGLRVRGRRAVSYDLVEADGLFESGRRDLRRQIERFGGSGRCVVVVDANVDYLYGDAMRQRLDEAASEHEVLVIAADEERKEIDLVLDVVAALDDFGIARRSEPVIAVGGGVVLDVVGLATSLYRRGIPYLRVPTTLLALVDAGVGVKTGINFDGHKSRLGTYYAPSTVLLDRHFLRTLDLRHIRNGAAEIAKMAIIKDAALFDLLERQGPQLVETRFQDATGGIVVRRAIRAMLDELEPNLWELQLERVVDFGHSFSGRIEMDALPALLHGEAVAIDMALSTVLAYHRGFVTSEQRDRVLALLVSLGLPIDDPLCEAPRLWQALEETTRHRDGLQRLPLPGGIGRARFVSDVSYDEVEEAVLELRPR
jgi:3-dehydroquinate synthetase/predicted NBD/HSP70 family sugar kinase